MEITLSVNASHCHLPRKGEVLMLLPGSTEKLPHSGELASVSETERVVLR